MSLPFAFISYSRKDTAFVERLENALRARGIATWRDTHSIPGGTRWFRRIQEGLEASYVMIYVDTQHGQDSEWVEQEFIFARYLKLPIIPLKLDAAFASFQAIHLQPILCDAANFESGVLKLIAQLQAMPRVPIKPGAVAPPSATSEPAETHDTPLTPRDFTDYLEWVLAHTNWERVNAFYVELSAVSERQRANQFWFKDDDDFDFSAVGIERLDHADFEKPGTEVPDARTAIRAPDMRRTVLLGDPGAGKTTTLLKLVVDMARAAQANPADPALKLPVYVPLREFNGALSFEDFVRSKTHNLQADYDRLTDRFVLLCDALNEMPRRAADGRDLVAEVRETLRRKPDWVVSCRVRDYTDDLSAIPDLGKIRLKPLDLPRIQQFIVRKFNGWGEPERGAVLWAELGGNDNLLAAWRAFAEHDNAEGFWGKDWRMREPHQWSDEAKAWEAMHRDHRRLMVLCRSPFMANMVSALYRRSPKLPDNRAGLFTVFVGNLLEAEKKRLTAIGAAWIGDAPIRAGMGQIAWAMGAQTEMERTGAEALLTQHVAAHDPAEVLKAAASAGLIDYGVAVRFTHQLIQQYFAASVLGALMDAGIDPATLWHADQWWESTGREETAILLAGNRNDPHGVARWIAPAQPEFAVELLSQPDFALDLTALESETRTALVNGAHGKTSTVAPRGRAAAYRVLGKFEADTRPGIGLRSDGLPEIDWVDIPAGDFLYQDGQKLWLPTFAISRYLVTYRQFQTFIDAPDGWRNPEWWKDLAEPNGWQESPYEQYFQYWNHPRERVTWYQAMAFCNWLSAKLEQTIRLPREEEWEKAASWDAANQRQRVYPWGDTFDATKCNSRVGANPIDMTSAVGIFPDGESAYKVLDMSGNVWEWCLNEYYQPQNVQPGGDSPRVLRGASWGFNTDDLRAAYRNDSTPDDRYNSGGVRLARSY